MGARMKNRDALINLTKEIENPDHADENLNVQLFMRILRGRLYEREFQVSFWTFGCRTLLVWRHALQTFLYIIDCRVHGINSREVNFSCPLSCL